jgi:hypothetical protein
MGHLSIKKIMEKKRMQSVFTSIVLAIMLSKEEANSVQEVHTYINLIFLKKLNDFSFFRNK